MEEFLLNNTVEKLQEELTLRAKYYFKGFGSLVQGLLTNLEYLKKLKRKPEDEKQAEEIINRMVSLYASIPFEQITNYPDYGLLSDIKEAISELHTEVETILSGERNIDRSCELINTISEKGMEYRMRLRALLQQIRLQPGHEKDGFEITDIHGKVWKYPF